jgi:hypothetical protein
LDKFKLQTKNKHAINEDELDLTVYTYIPKRDGELWSRVYFNPANNVTIIWDNFQLRIEFNPTIYKYGHNVKMCTLQECSEVVEDLSNELQVDLFDWEMVGYDFNVTIELNFKVAAYLPLLQELPRYRRNISDKDETETYQNRCKNRKFICYDKLEEYAAKKVKVEERIKRKTVVIPPTYSGKNLGRFEHSITNKMNEYDCYQDVETVRDFLTVEHWNHAADLFLRLITI